MCGARASEVCGLYVEDLDLRLDDEHVRIHGKGDSVRIVLLDDRGYVALLKLYLARGAGYTAGPLFRASVNGRGGSLSYDAAHHRWQSNCAAARVEIDIHQLCHAHAAELINAGVSIGAVRRRLGHASRATAAFRRRLTAQGWIVEPAGRGGADVVASRETQQLIGEVKGHTGDPGTDLDTAYGQLLRRMSHGGPQIRHALTVPFAICRHAERVPASIRQVLPSTCTSWTTTARSPKVAPRSSAPATRRRVNPHQAKDHGQHGKDRLSPRGTAATAPRSPRRCRAAWRLPSPPSGGACRPDAAADEIANAPVCCCYPHPHHPSLSQKPPHGKQRQ
ncbi:site-specific integrase [Nonomuraea sp. NPDC050786]|uniref:tyrosine-type recombinase/integrase n=1 Tax=Nonomuraea sp. NPDC050786 TaxID=3154840 RepID=UPI0033CF7D17